MATEEENFYDQGEPICRQVDPDMFFPEPDDPNRNHIIKMAKKACGVCPYQNQCLASALERDEKFGIWGGMTEQERRRLKRGVVLAEPKRWSGK